MLFFLILFLGPKGRQFTAGNITAIVVPLLIVFLSLGAIAVMKDEWVPKVKNSKVFEKISEWAFCECVSCDCVRSSAPPLTPVRDSVPALIAVRTTAPATSGVSSDMNIL